METIRYLDFDLLIDRFGDKYKARVINSPSGQAATDFAAPFSADELRAFWSQLEDCLRKNAPASADCKTTLKPFGAQLFETVFAGQVRNTFSACLNAAGHESAGLRLRLRLAEAPELAALPWEFLYDPSNHRFLSLSNQTPIVRYLDLPERIKPLAVQPPLRMLVMIASPYDLPALEVEHEWENLKSALAEAEQRGLVQLERLETATLPALQKRLREKPFHLFHFIGHGNFDEAAQTGVLYVENDDRKKRAVRGDELGILLHDEETLRVAVLNACRGSRSASRDPFSGMAQRLVQQGIPAVIAMQAPISDTAALTFSQEFYRAMAIGYPVDAAVAEGRKALFAQGNEVEWGTPVLFMRSPDGRIFDMASVPGKDGDDLKTKGVNRKTKDVTRKTENVKKEKHIESPTAVRQSVTGAGGQVIQAGRDVVITQPQSEADEKKDIGKRIALWLGIVATVVTIITSIIQFAPDAFAPKSARFFGEVRYANKPEGVVGALVEVRSQIDGPVIGSGKTGSNGAFNFSVKEKNEETVYVTITLGDSVGFEDYLPLAGSPSIPFKPFKRKP